jgi:RES domain-containing protein
MRVWRLLRAEFASDPLSGEGASIAGGRWNSRGRPAVYTADSLASAVLEVLVHLEGGLPAATYIAAELELPGDILLSKPGTEELQDGWDAVPYTSSSTAFGDRWLQDCATVGLVVPSVIVPVHPNVVLNPGHPDFARVTVVGAQRFTFDRRLLFRPLQ